MSCFCLGVCACAAAMAMGGLLGYYWYDHIQCIEDGCYENAIVIDANKLPGYDSDTA